MLIRVIIVKRRKKRDNNTALLHNYKHKSTNEITCRLNVQAYYSINFELQSVFFGTPE